MAQIELKAIIDGLSADTTPDGAADLLLTLDDSADALKKVLPDNLGVGKIKTGTPASAGATGVAGQIRWDASFIYICTATNTWKRVAIATW